MLSLQGFCQKEHACNIHYDKNIYDRYDCLSWLFSMLKHLQNRQMLFFLLSLVALLLAYPYLETTVLGTVILWSLNIVILFAAVNAISYDHSNKVIAASIGVLAVCFQTIYVIFDNQIIIWLYFLCMFVFYGLTIVELLMHMFSQQRIHVETYYAAISVFILIGLAWSALYMIVFLITPESFNLTGSWTDPWWSLVYFSFVTLTTVWYGDTVPLTPHVRSLAMIQAIMWVMYNAILIAKLIAWEHYKRHISHINTLHEEWSLVSHTPHPWAVSDDQHQKRWDQRWGEEVR